MFNSGHLHLIDAKDCQMLDNTFLRNLTLQWYYFETTLKFIEMINKKTDWAIERQQNVLHQDAVVRAAPSSSSTNQKSNAGEKKSSCETSREKGKTQSNTKKEWTISDDQRKKKQTSNAEFTGSQNRRETVFTVDCSNVTKKKSSFCDSANDVADDVKLPSSIASNVIDDVKSDSSGFETSPVKPTADEDFGISDVCSVFSQSSEVKALVSFIICFLQKSNDLLLVGDLSNSSNPMRGAESSTSMNRRGISKSFIHSRFSNITNMRTSLSSLKLSNTSHYSEFFNNTDAFRIDPSDSSWIDSNNNCNDIQSFSDDNDEPKKHSNFGKDFCGFSDNNNDYNGLLSNFSHMTALKTTSVVIRKAFVIGNSTLLMVITLQRRFTLVYKLS